MNEPVFDIRGNLTPYTVIDASIDDVEKWFVLPFDQASSRHQIIADYKRYVIDLKAIIGLPFCQWLNGSFTISVENPGNIDIVTFIDDKVYQSYQATIDNRFSKRAVDAYYPAVDSYVVRSYPPSYRNFLTFQADEAYWYDWFSKTRRDRNRNRYSKGFIRVNIE